MEHPRSRQAYRIVIAALGLVTLLVLTVIGVVVAAGRSPSPEAVARTLTALPTLTPTLTPTPTPVPTLPGVSAELLVCQRQMGTAMNARGMVGTVNISDDHLLLVSWVSTDWSVRGMDDALSGLIMAFDAALDVWERGCAVYDRIQIDVWDGSPEQRTHRLTVRTTMDDLLRWRAGEFGDRDLIARLQVTEPAR